ncbi:ImmA/IrrE family metallo-endopeptidase [Sphingobacterium chungjuense]|uniref:ImmA/IrrE family metallo-endopeptidase n=1 Tax=Sphingobacterium chungjuense TaxID=2675553 RepID=UPI00140E4A6D|nr:ImmA/IrrE family metallo-endopeptidase [Sphingobacterium chungjuense]
MKKDLHIEKELLTKPGDTILETLEFLKMSQVELSERLGKTPGKVNDIISGKVPITVNTALQLEKVLGIETQFWLNRESNYREKLARLEQQEQLDESIDWLREQPVKELFEQGYISTKKVRADLAQELLQFYGVASPVQWKNLYVNSYVHTNFRKSEKQSEKLSCMAAWLRIGELKLRQKQYNSYSKEEFKSALHQIKKLVQRQPEDYAEKLASICARAGVALIYSKSMKKAPISGATRWVANIPLIQITDRYKTNDSFWFTFYHEAGHILLHGKKDTFIEEFEEVEIDNEKEAEANSFARDWLLPDSFLDQLSKPITEGQIRRIANDYNVHPAIVVGRLQHLKIVPHHFGTNLKVKINLTHFINL